MKRKHLAALAVVLLICIVLFAWTQTRSNISPTQNARYEIVSLIPYDKNLCISIGSQGDLQGFDTGLNVVLKDNDTGKKLNGSILITMGKGASGGGADTGYSCEEDAGSQKAVISAYSTGYAPSVFEFDLPIDQLATVAVPMTKGCSGANACFDKLMIVLLESAGGNQTKADEMLKSSQDRFYETIQRNYGLEKTDYDLACTECDLGRGGFIKAKGTYKDGTPLELYYHWGWCSSGGTDCGWSNCFASDNKQLFDSVKNMSCQKLSYYERVEDTSVPGVVSMKTVEDRSNQTITECLSGKYDDKTGNMYAISMIQEANRYETSVEKGNTDCMVN